MTLPSQSITFWEKKNGDKLKIKNNVYQFGMF